MRSGLARFERLVAVRQMVEKRVPAVVHPKGMFFQEIITEELEFRNAL